MLEQVLNMSVKDFLQMLENDADKYNTVNNIIIDIVNSQNSYDDNMDLSSEDELSTSDENDYDEYNNQSLTSDSFPTFDEIDSTNQNDDSINNFSF